MKSFPVAIALAMLIAAVGGAAAADVGPFRDNPTFAVDDRAAAEPAFLAAVGSQGKDLRVRVRADPAGTIAAGHKACQWLDARPSAIRDAWQLRERYTQHLRSRGEYGSWDGTDWPGWIAERAWPILCGYRLEYSDGD